MGRLVRVAMPDEARHLGDAQGEWYYCLVHQKAEPLEGCHQADRMGPYPTPEEAEHWRDRVAARNEEWDADDETL